MRFIIYGTGAIGATIAARLQQSGRDVVSIARGAHARALREHGLRFESHAGVEHIALSVVEHPAELQFRDDDVVVMAMKTQDLGAALDALVAVAPELPVACAQNGVEAERLALRRFERVYGIAVLVPAVFLEPGVVQVFATPLTGVLDLGRYPHGSDALSQQLSAALGAANFGSEVRDDIQRLKYAKLLSNIGNAIEALCGPEARKAGVVAELVRDEALAVLRAAGIDPDSAGLGKRAAEVIARPLAGQARPGGSSWQSLSRQTGNIESDYLNGEIVLLGRLHGVPTPVNQVLQRCANEFARKRLAPGSLALDRLQQLIEQARASQA